MFDIPLSKSLFPLSSHLEEGSCRLYSKEEMSERRARETAQQLSLFGLATAMGRCEGLSSLLSLPQRDSQSSSSGFAFVVERNRETALQNANCLFVGNELIETINHSSQRCSTLSANPH